jgi:hypothetical protein
MIRNRIYYTLKPLLPSRLRLAIRRWYTLRKRARASDVWPVLPGSEVPPKYWTGWPEGKQFAVVLTHDVEGKRGLDNCLRLMELESRAGFRSSFNFIPEGSYVASAEVRDQLTQNGFEVGVHDLHHDGKLFRTRSEFRRKAVRINQYLKDWGAVGFRAGFMLHNLEWQHELNIAYDASTFDTDPFEPQPDAAQTIFPFWVPRPKSDGQIELQKPPYDAGAVAESQQGYVELPYTLPQDSTVFLLLGERSPAIWSQKLDWVAKHGGMVLVNVHPDYMAMNGDRPTASQFPADFYRRFLEHIRSHYSGAFWHVLPRDIAQFTALMQHKERLDNPGRHSVVDAVWPP